VSHQARSQQETTVAINPHDPSQVFIAANDDFPSGRLFSARSSDGGATWAQAWIATGSDGLPAACCDASASWDRYGNLFLSYLASGHVIIALSRDAGASFSVVAQLTTTPAADFPRLATGAGSVWVSWEDYSLSGNPRLIVRGA